MGDFNRGGPRRDSHSGGPRRNFGSGGRGGPRGNFGPREMHKAVCASCGQECEVPFKPREGRDVFCKDCFAKKREEEGPSY